MRRFIAIGAIAVTAVAASASPAAAAWSWGISNTGGQGGDDPRCVGVNPNGHVIVVPMEVCTRSPR